jgi:energy-coupling factor transporter transmembrane protein EcfT
MYFAENLINNFGQSQAFTIYMAFFLFFILFVGSLIFVKFFLREKKWFYLTILIMIFLLVIGYSLINDIVGNQKLNLNLLENGKNIVGEIKCKGVQGPLVEGGVFCETNIDVPLVNKTQTMVVTLEGIGKE